MMRSMVHRGPDDEGYEEIALGDAANPPTIGFGFRRLAIQDLTSTGHQPMFNPNTGDCLVFNGEIYNFPSLRSELQCDGVRFRGTSDTEVLLHALSKWGESALQRITGMYAFIFYHAASRRALLARDPLGIKPLYVAEIANGVVFASEVRAVLASGLVPDDLDQAGVATMLAYGAPQDPLTVHRAIKSFPAGSYGWIEAREKNSVVSLDSRRFWRFPQQVCPATTPNLTVSHTRSLLEAAVAKHLVADRSVGVFLSAGIDSFAIAALARVARSSVVTFTVGFDEPGTSDEIHEAASAAKILDTDHRPIILNAFDVTPLWTDWLSAADRPSIDGFNTFVVSQAVAAAGKTVALSGLGGDEMFGGYPNFTSVRRYRQILTAIRPVPRVLRELGLHIATRGRRSTFREKAIELFGGSPELWRIALRLRRILTDRQILRLGLTPDAIGLDAEFLDPEALASTAADHGSDEFNIVSQIESVLYMGNTLLRDTDINSMAHSIEVRVPYISPRFAARALAFSGSVRRGNGKTPKHLLRKAVADILPHRVLDRAKTGFTLPVNEWMFGSMRDSCESAVAALENVPFLDHTATIAAWETMVRNRHHSYWMKPMLLVALGSYISSLKRRD